MQKPTSSNSLKPVARYKRSLSARFLISVGFVIYANIVTWFYLASASHGQDLGLGVLVYVAYGLLASTLAFVTSMIIFGLVLDKKQSRLALLFLTVGISLYPFAINAIHWMESRQYDAQAKKVQLATTIQDCKDISFSFDWTDCVRKTLKSVNDLAECQQQGRTKHDTDGKTLESACQNYLTQIQQKSTLQASADSVKGLQGCEKFARDKQLATWKFCISAKGITSRPDYDECYRQAKLQPVPTTGYWPMGQYCGNFYKESFGH